MRIDDLAGLLQPIFFFDNNLSIHIAKAFRELGEQAYHLQEFLPPDADDLDWIPEVGRLGLTLVTMDEELRHRPSERAAYVEHRVGGFALRGKRPPIWSIVKQLVKSWEEMKQLAVKTPRPYVFRVRIGGKIEKPPMRL